MAVGDIERAVGISDPDKVPESRLGDELPGPSGGLVHRPNGVAACDVQQLADCNDALRVSDLPDAQVLKARRSVNGDPAHAWHNRSRFIKDRRLAAARPALLARIGNKYLAVRDRDLRPGFR